MDAKRNEDGTFGAGNSGGPGRSAGTQGFSIMIRTALRHDRTHVVKVIDRALAMTQPEVGEALKDPATPALDAAVYGILKRAVLDGDPVRLAFLLKPLGINLEVQDKSADQTSDKILRTIPRERIIALIKEGQNK